MSKKKLIKKAQLGSELNPIFGNVKQKHTQL